MTVRCYAPSSIGNFAAGFDCLGFGEVKHAAMQAGAIASSLAGSGPAVFAVVEPRRAQARHCRVDPIGARLLGQAVSSDRLSTPSRCA